LVRLGGLLELRLRVRRRADVRVQLTGLAPEGLLDLVLGGPAGNAEDLVVVPLHPSIRRRLAGASHAPTPLIGPGGRRLKGPRGPPRPPRRRPRRGGGRGWPGPPR